jgi:hypothetical protein
MDRREQFINPVTREEKDLRARGRQWFAEAAKDSARDQAELESWYQDYHHWHHFDARDRTRQGYALNFAEPVTNAIYFRWFRWLLGLPPKAPPSRYDRYRFMPNKRPRAEAER